MGFFKSLFGEMNEPVKRNRDYGRELMASDPDMAKGVQFNCALDEKTCLTCLELDGTLDPPALPIHQGCRCVTLPVLYSWEELAAMHGGNTRIGREVDAVGKTMSTRASAIGQVPEDGGAYKAYLIQRARAIKNGLAGDELNQFLKKVQLELQGKYPKENEVLVAIRTFNFIGSSSQDLNELRDILATISGYIGNYKELFSVAVKAGEFSLLNDTLARLSAQVPQSKYANRHKGTLYRDAGDAAKKHSLEKAIEYYNIAKSIDSDNTAILIELAKMYRRAKQPENAIPLLKQALRINPALKGAGKELEALTTSK